eukprot:TRINITY_DN2738_c0_g2_i1.p1 TRINITY_DN2738_c0_g2~~TRINITY_DN2738_c0_g2_i1.p1  ORF type:complete len:324 (-),score=64.92 TRINITY_DN2738_c0_g2_i1:164-1135(-)
MAMSAVMQCCQGGQVLSALSQLDTPVRSCSAPAYPVPAVRMQACSQNNTTQAGFLRQQQQRGMGMAMPQSQSTPFAGGQRLFVRDARSAFAGGRTKQMINRCASVVASAATDLEGKREELKGKLRNSLESNIGNLTEEELGIIDELSKITPDSEPAKNLEMVKGGYRLLNSTMPGILYRGAKLTLGRATFSVYPPAELPMTLHEVYNEVDGGKYYDVYQDVTLEPEGLPAMKAKILNRAEYVLEGDKRIAVEFTESKLTPAEGTDLAVWKKVFKDNPDMEEDGTMKRVFPKGKPGWVDILYQDKSFRITKGNFGNIVIVERET